MEGSDEEVRSRIAQESSHPLPHLSGCTMGKGQCEDLIRWDTMPQKITDSSDYGERFARSGPGNHKDMPIRCRHSAFLRLV